MLEGCSGFFYVAVMKYLNQSNLIWKEVYFRSQFQGTVHHRGLSHSNRILKQLAIGRNRKKIRPS